MSVRPDQPVSSVMSWPVATIDHEATLEEAAEALASDNVGVLLVLRDRGLAGLLSERDVVAHVAAGADPERLRAGEIMATELVTAPPGATVAEAARLMVDADIRHLPVLDGRLIAGLVSVRDVLPVLLSAVETDSLVGAASRSDADD